MNQGNDMNEALYAMTKASKVASQELAQLNSEQKNLVLKAMSEQLAFNQSSIIEANKRDLALAKTNDLSEAMQDRLMLNKSRIEGMMDALNNVISLNDPIGEMSLSQLRPNGIRVSKMRIPLGVILMIYESRPNVAVEAAALTLKSGNAIILRGGKEAYHSNLALVDCWHKALSTLSLPTAMINIVPTQDHSAINQLLNFGDTIDLVIPRGGEKLIRTVSENSKIPVIQHFKGVCHLYVDQDADLAKALDILVDGKVSRPGVCNALESLVVHEAVAKEFLPQLSAIALKYNIGLKINSAGLPFLTYATLANDSDYATEYLSLDLNIKVVTSYKQAVEHIQTFSSDHTEVIITENFNRANDFIKQINSSVVMVNTSSRFSDGGELGLGAEIGISTSKLHAYGPMGLYQLTTEKFVVTGEGQIRHPESKQ